MSLNKNMPSVTNGIELWNRPSTAYSFFFLDFVICHAVICVKDNYRFRLFKFCLVTLLNFSLHSFLFLFFSPIRGKFLLWMCCLNTCFCFYVLNVPTVWYVQVKMLKSESTLFLYQWIYSRLFCWKLFRDPGNGVLMDMEPSCWSTVTQSGHTGRNQTVSRTMSPEFRVKKHSFLFTNKLSLSLSFLPLHPQLLSALKGHSYLLLQSQQIEVLTW